MKCCKCHKEDSVGHGIHFWYFKSQVVLCEDCYEKYGVERMVFEHKFLTDALDNKMTTEVLETAPEWIPIKMRPGTDEEYEEFSQYGDCPREDFRVFECPLPDDDQEVLVTTRWGNVCVDIWHREVDCCYFENNSDDDDVIAWMPLPKPYKSEVQDEDS